MAKKVKAKAQTPKQIITIPPKESTALVIPEIKKTAMSKDLGPVVIAALAKISADETQAKHVLESVTQKRYDLQSKLTQGIVKAAVNDKTINLADIFSVDKKKKMLLGNQIGIALGYREVITVGSGPKAKTTIAYAKSVQQFFPHASDKDKESPEAIAKDTFRTNWTHRITQCIQVACGIIERKLKADIDKSTGVLRLSGPAIKQQFGAPSVLLNEKQSVGDGKAKLKLKEKPSFTSIASAASEAHGKVSMRKSTARATVTVDPNKAVQSMASAFVAACEKLDKNKLLGPTRQALESVQNAIELVIG